MLTDAGAGDPKTEDTPHRLSDALCLSIETPERWQARAAQVLLRGKEKGLAFGIYGGEQPASLLEARSKQDTARKLLSQELDPVVARQAQQATGTAGDTFEVIARQWFAKHKATWAASRADKITQRLERDIFPWLGARPIGGDRGPGPVGGPAAHRESGAKESGGQGYGASCASELRPDILQRGR